MQRIKNKPFHLHQMWVWSLHTKMNLSIFIFIQDYVDMYVCTCVFPVAQL